MRKTLILVLLLGLGLTPPSTAQLIVHDPGNATINSVTSVQTTISAVENVVQSAYMVLELTPFDDIVLSAEFLETVGTLELLIEEGQGVMGDAESARGQIARLFALDTVPTSLDAYSERMVEIKAVIYEARVYSVRVQTLMSTLKSALTHLVRIVTLIGNLTGNMQGNQAVLQAIALTNQILATNGAQTAAAQRAAVLEHLGRSFASETYRTMEARRWADWPTF